MSAPHHHPHAGQRVVLAPVGGGVLLVSSGMGTPVSSHSERSGLDSFVRALRERGVPDEHVATVLDVLADMESAETPTDAELAFLRTAGISAEVFSAETAQQNALYLLQSETFLAEETAHTLISTKVVADILGVTPAEVRDLADKGDIMAADEVDGQAGYPRWQFTNAGTVVPGLREILHAFPRDYHPLDIQLVMTTADPELGDRSPKEWLEDGMDQDTIVQFVADLSYM